MNKIIDNFDDFFNLFQDEIEAIKEVPSILFIHQSLNGYKLKASEYSNSTYKNTIKIYNYLDQHNIQYSIDKTSTNIDCMKFNYIFLLTELSFMSTNEKSFDWINTSSIKDVVEVDMISAYLENEILFFFKLINS